MYEEKREHIRCPECGGRLFDVIKQKKNGIKNEEIEALQIKCWKCHNTISLDQKNNYLVQASHERSEND